MRGNFRKGSIALRQVWVLVRPVLVGTEATSALSRLGLGGLDFGGPGGWPSHGGCALHFGLGLGLLPRLGALGLGSLHGDVRRLLRRHGLLHGGVRLRVHAGALIVLDGHSSTTRTFTMTWLFALLEGFTCWLAVEDPCGEGTLRHESLILANGEERSCWSKASCLDDEDDDWRDEGRQSDVVGCLRRDRGPDGCQHVL